MHRIGKMGSRTSQKELAKYFQLTCFRAPQVEESETQAKRLLQAPECGTCLRTDCHCRSMGQATRCSDFLFFNIFFFLWLSGHMLLLLFKKKKVL